MAATFKQLTDFLMNMGIDKIGHTDKTYLAHLIAVYRTIKDRGGDEDLSRAGMFHSIYGTERFQGFKLELDQRDNVRQLIGTRAEELAYLNCAMDRASFDAALDGTGEVYSFKDRLTGTEVRLGRADYDDLCRVHLYDWLEQVPRCQCWDYRRASYRKMAERIGPVATETFDKVYAQEAVA